MKVRALGLLGQEGGGAPHRSLAREEVWGSLGLCWKGQFSSVSGRSRAVFVWMFSALLGCSCVHPWLETAGFHRGFFMSVPFGISGLLA